MQVKNLPHLLKELRGNMDLSRERMAETVGISASYVSILENLKLDTPKIPSIDVLQKYVSCFVDEQPQLVFSILLAAAKFDREFILPVGQLSSEAQRRRDKNFHEVWTLSDYIPENRDERLFTLTRDKIRDGVTKYVYFVPPGDEQWETLYDRLSRTQGMTETTIVNSVMCIETTPLLCELQIVMGISNKEGRSGFIEIGNRLHPGIYPLEADQTFASWKVLSRVIREFRRGLENTEMVAGYIVFKRVFP